MIKEKIKLRIEKDKRISFSQYMESVLFDKEYGLYETERVFGANGLFVTSPLTVSYTHLTLPTKA